MRYIEGGQPAFVHDERSHLRPGRQCAVVDNAETGETQEPGTVETGAIENVEANDPGPIEIDVVMKSVSLVPTDPMADRDLHLHDVGGHEADDGGE
jgi:hypothetical protein